MPNNYLLLLIKLGKIPHCRVGTVRERPFNLKGGVMVFFLKKYSDFGGGKKNNLIKSFCHIT
jgi:hypothetical protein